MNFGDFFGVTAGTKFPNVSGRLHWQHQSADPQCSAIRRTRFRGSSVVTDNVATRFCRFPRYVGLSRFRELFFLFLFFDFTIVAYYFVARRFYLVFSSRQIIIYINLWSFCNVRARSGRGVP